MTPSLNLNLFLSPQLPIEEHYPGIIGPSSTFPGSQGCPLAAVLLYHMRSGLLDQYEMNDSSILERIPTEPKIQAAVARYRDRTGSLLERKACAGCGLVRVQSKMHKVDIGSPLVQHLRHDESFTARYRQLSALGKSAHNCVEHADEVYALRL